MKPTTAMSVEQAGENHLLRQPVLLREVRALQQVGLGRREAQAEEVEQGRLRGHRREPRVLPHELALPPRPGAERAFAVGKIVEERP